ncbi:hypothetical protein BX666DRAFT_838771 [Dichotomocladium elegans]|nr:hypothetical protein BX666DRAFT_838771 [Dichotomocladium elegans]
MNGRAVLLSAPQKDCPPRLFSCLPKAFLHPTMLPPSWPVPTGHCWYFFVTVASMLSPGVGIAWVPFIHLLLEAFSPSPACESEVGTPLAGVVVVVVVEGAYKVAGMRRAADRVAFATSAPPLNVTWRGALPKKVGGGRGRIVLF